MMGKSASLFEWLLWGCLGFGLFVFRGRRLGAWAVCMGRIKQGLHLCLGMGAMCRGSCVKDHGYGHVQLESLILAQNERWRQA